MFVTFEGPEGGGKSTALAWVAERLREEGRRVVVTREPGSGEVGARIREILLHGEALDARAELFLFLADRAQHVASVVRPALEAGDVVLCDRYGDSTVVYQAHARGLDPERIRELNAIATQDLVPDMTLLLDLPVEVGLARIATKDRLDSEPVQFHERVRKGFLLEAERDPRRWRVVDATKGAEAVRAACLELVRTRLEIGAEDALPFEGLG